MRFSSFSDLIVRSIPVDSSANYQMPHGILFHELLDLIHIQINLLNRGVLIRGGVTVGYLYHDDTFVFGPALNEAYRLESEVAKFPRIVLTENTAEIIRDERYRNYIHDYFEEKAGIHELLREDEGGLFFLDYLRVAASELDDFETYPVLIKAHRDLIQNGLHNKLAVTGVAEKYFWLAAYHNDVVRHFSDLFSDLGEAIDDLKVDTSDLPLCSLIYQGNEVWRDSR